MDEYSPSEEIGIPEDRQFISSCHGFITTNDNARNLCAHYIRNGGRVFDVLSAYQDVPVLSQSAAREGHSKEMMRLIVPLLKVSGITDHGAYMFGKGDLRLMPGADKAVRYLNRTQPFFVNTSSYEHHMMNVSDAVGFPMSNVNCSQVSFDSIEIGRDEGKVIRDMIARISRMDPEGLPDSSVGPGSYIPRESWDAVQELDSMFLDRMPLMDFYDQLDGVVAVGPNDKSYALLEIRRQSNIDFDSTFYLGGGASDHRAMDIVRDGGGLAVSFNGCADSVRNSNIAVISSDAITVAVLAAEFYNEGPEAVYDLIEGWDRTRLEEKGGPDRNLVRRLLETFPRKLPEVFIVEDGDPEGIGERSEAYRRRFYRRP